MKKQLEQQYVLLKDVVIPAGTVLETAPLNRGGYGAVEAIVAMGDDATAHFNMTVSAINDAQKDLITKLK